jgi:hypothetical protein
MDPILFELKACLKELAQLQKQAPNLSKVFNKEQLALIREVKTLIENEQLAKGRLVSSEQQEIPTAENEEKASLENEETYSSAEKSITQIENNGIKNTEEYQRAKDAWDQFESTIESFISFLSKNEEVSYDAKVIFQKMTLIKQNFQSNVFLNYFADQTLKRLKNEDFIIGHALHAFYQISFPSMFDGIIYSLEKNTLEEAVEKLKNSLEYPSLGDLKGLFNPYTVTVTNTDEPVPPLPIKKMVASVVHKMDSKLDIFVTLKTTITVRGGDTPLIDTLEVVIPCEFSLVNDETGEAFYKTTSNKLSTSRGGGNNNFQYNWAESEVIQEKSTINGELSIVGIYALNTETNAVQKQIAASIELSGGVVSGSANASVALSNSTTTASNSLIIKDILKFELTQVYNLKKTLKLVKVSNNPKDKPKQIAEDFENDKGELVPKSYYLTLSSEGINFEVNGIHLSTTVHIGPIGNKDDNIYHKYDLDR